ncbi:hypothetical protein MHYP_G00056850 [Metynnis hypsauchen]
MAANKDIQAEQCGGLATLIVAIQQSLLTCHQMTGMELSRVNLYCGSARGGPSPGVDSTQGRDTPRTEGPGNGRFVGTTKHSIVIKPKVT